MPDPTNNSFIPKRNPVQKERIRGRKVYIGTLVVQVVFFAALAGSALVYWYESKLNSNLEAEVSSLNNAISTFNEKDMDRVLGFNNRLEQLNYRFDNAASVVKLLEVVEDSTAGSVQIEKITLEKNTDTSFEIESQFITNSFDSALFQRKLIESDNSLVVRRISDLSLENVPPSGLAVEGTVEQVKVSFKADLDINVEKIKPGVTNTSIPEVIIAPSTTETVPEIIIDEVLSEEPEESNPEIL